MKESILLTFLLLLLTIETDGNILVLRRKQSSRDRCHRLQEVRLCPGAPKSWHYDVRVSECRSSNEEECGSVGNRFQSKEDCQKICIDRCHRMRESRLCVGAPKSWHYDVRVSECRNSNEEECGSLGNQFQSKEDCENICPGRLNISARQAYIHPHPQPGINWPNPCCGHRTHYPCNRQCCPNCGHNRPCCYNHTHPTGSPTPVSTPPQPIHHCPRHCCPYPIHPCPGHCNPCCDHHRHDCNWRCCYNHTHPTGSPTPRSTTPGRPPPEYGFLGLKSLCPSNLHCPTVCSSSRLTPELNSRCCGCRPGTIIRPPCSSHDDRNCGSTKVAPPTASEPIIGVICPITDPDTRCKMHCEFGFKKTSAGCPYCECEESSHIDPDKSQVP